MDEILARFIQPMATYARDLLSHKCYRAARGGDNKVLEKLLGDEKAKNPKRIPYFFSSSKQYPGKFVLAYQPGSKARFEYVTVIPDGFRYRNQISSSVNDLVTWFKAHYRDPIPRPIPTTSVPPHVMAASQRVDPNMFSHLQAAVNTAHQRGGTTGSTPYTPSQWVTSPTPQYRAAYSQQYGGYAYQQGQYGGSQYGHGHSGSYGGYHQKGGWNPPPNWTPSQSIPRTPTHTPGRTPAYTPTQTPQSYMGGSLQGTPLPYGRVSYLHGRRTPVSPMSTPLMDE